MKVITPGHVYALNNLDGNGKTILIFVKREGAKYPGNVGSHEGTNMQEVIRALISRIKYLDQQDFDHRNDLVISNLRLSLYYLEERAAERHRRILNTDIIGIEFQPTCSKCGHIGCDGECHPERL